MNIGERLKEYLKYSGMNANELAKIVGVSPSTIYSIIRNNNTRISIDLLIKIAHALGTTADDFLGLPVKKAPVPNSEDLEIIAAYRKASDDTKAAVCAVLGVRREMSSSDSMTA